MTLTVAAATTPPVPDPALFNACGATPGVLCRQVFNLTHSAWLANGAEVVLTKPIRILIVIAIAFIVRAVLHRLIGRLVRRATSGDLGDVLRRGRAPQRLISAVESSAAHERRRQRAETVGTLLRSVTSFVVFGVAFVTILGELGINLAPIVASAGIVGVAVGFGAQNLVRDFLTGIFMFVEDQYGVGDVVDIGPSIGSLTGTVEAVGLRTTRVRDSNGVQWYVRNGEIARVGNKSKGWARAVVDVPLPNAVPVERALPIVQSAVDAVGQDDALEELLLGDPQVQGVENLCETTYTVRVVARTVPGEADRVAHALRRRILADVDASGLIEQQQTSPETSPPADGRRYA